MTDPAAGPAPDAGLSHPALDADAVARLRERAGAPATIERVAPATSAATGPGEPPVGSAAKFKAKARQAATPVVARVRSELDRAASGEVAALRAEVAELRAELTRLRAEHEASLAARREDGR